MKESCPNCGGVINTVHLTCQHCQTKIIPERVLSDKQKEELTEFIEGVEFRLTASKKKNDIYVFLGFAATVIITMVASLKFYYMELGTSMLILLIFLAATGSFIGFGFIVGWMEDKAIKNTYETEIKQDIEQYLDIRAFYRYEFDLYASKHLKEGKSSLKKFLFDYAK